MTTSLREQYAAMKDFRRIYRDTGPYHARAQGFTAWFLRDNYSAIAAACRGSGRALDLACGEGCLAPHLEVGELVGLDYSPEALALNRQLHPGAYRELVLGDMRELDSAGLSSGSFDSVVCSLSLMYLAEPDLLRCLGAVLALLRPGARFVFTYPTVSSYREANPTAAELPAHEVHARLSAVGWRELEFRPICPLLPAEIVEQSTGPGVERARVAYDEAARTMTMAHCYHWLCCARAPL